MKVKLIGAGAVGLSVANKLLNHSELSLIVDDERKARYSCGLKYNGKIIDIPFASDSRTDLLIVAVKNFHLESSLDLIGRYVSEYTVILPLLNGIDSERVLSRTFGSKKVLYGFITDLSANHQGLETVCFSDGGTIVFGERDNRMSERVMDIAKLFDVSSQRYRIPDDIIHEKWWKFMLNTCFNTLSAILEADYSDISENSDFIRLVRMIAKEVQAVAASEGVAITYDDIDRMIRTVTRLTDSGQTSMLQDVLAHRQTENEYFAGAISRLGKAHGVDTQICDFVNIMLEAKRYVYNR